MATRIKPRPERSSARAAAQGLGPQGLRPAGEVHWNSIPPELVQAAIRRGEGELADMGPFVAVMDAQARTRPLENGFGPEAPRAREAGIL